ncbi:methylaspartate mutase [Kitasatospora mediocidica]|uniref:methylaspartate mutase n=1 Tax=Kitasatospora mediocidica TaxID=58352 RepID=UPI0006925B42|nr:methylaspartate mutase [Kitasatospora mediocidica]
MTGPQGAAPVNAFADFVRRSHARGSLVVQPRMGFGDPRAMREGLIAVKGANATTVGTITLDSYTRLGKLADARRAVAEGGDLNGYPIRTHATATNLAVLEGVRERDFPVQVRHGSAAPQGIIASSLEAGLDTTEGGPVSYCLPYGRLPLRQAVQNWAQSCEVLVQARERGLEPHVETFGGCMLGQLCPPSLLVAISLLEGLFFRQHGLRSVSLSYAQQTNAAQDREAVLALRRLADTLMPDLDCHIVIYNYMGVYPRTRAGALLLLEQAAELAVRTGAERLIVKTAAEAHRIPTVGENVEALEIAALAAQNAGGYAPSGLSSGSGSGVAAAAAGSEVLDEATALVHAVLDLNEDIGAALVEAFARGLLDVPYCLHPDNAGRSRSFIESDGRLRWSHTGSLPVRASGRSVAGQRMTATDLLQALSYVEQTFDRAAATNLDRALRAPH